MAFLLTAICLVIGGLFILGDNFLRIYQHQPLSRDMGWPAVLENYLALNPGIQAEIVVAIVLIALGLGIGLTSFLFSGGGERLLPSIRAALRDHSSFWWVGVGLFVGACPLGFGLQYLITGGADGAAVSATLQIASLFVLFGLLSFAVDARQQPGPEDDNEPRTNPQPVTVECQSCGKEFTLVEGASRQVAYCIYCHYAGPAKAARRR